MAKRDSVTIRLLRADAEVVLAMIADGVMDGSGEVVETSLGTHRNFDAADIRALLRAWKHFRKSMRRLPFDWVETAGHPPRWARHQR